MFDTEETKELVEVIAEHLSYCHEKLRDDFDTVEAAMKEFDSWPIVRAYAKIDPEKHAKHRHNIELEVVDALPREADLGKSTTEEGPARSHRHTSVRPTHRGYQ